MKNVKDKTMAILGLAFTPELIILEKPLQWLL